jgi:hypothetical protein
MSTAQNTQRRKVDEQSNELKGMWGKKRSWNRDLSGRLGITPKT